jgi:hypothetical protein
VSTITITRTSQGVRLRPVETMILVGAGGRQRLPEVLKPIQAAEKRRSRQHGEWRHTSRVVAGHPEKALMEEKNSNADRKSAGLGRSAKARLRPQG